MVEACGVPYRRVGVAAPLACSAFQVSASGLRRYFVACPSLLPLVFSRDGGEVKSLVACPFGIVDTSPLATAVSRQENQWTIMLFAESRSLPQASPNQYP